MKSWPIRCASVNDARVRDAQEGVAVGRGVPVGGGAVEGSGVGEADAGVDDGGTAVGEPGTGVAMVAEQPTSDRGRDRHGDATCSPASCDGHRAHS